MHTPLSPISTTRSRTRSLLAAATLLVPSTLAQVTPQPVLENTRLAGDPLPFHGHWGLLVAVSEVEQGGQDLNADGDALDEVPAILDVASGRATVVKQPLDDARFVDGGLVLLAGQGGPPFQLYTYVRGQLKIQATGLFAHDLSGGGARALLHVSEKLAGVDLTGDGDALDTRVLHSWSPAGGLANHGVDVAPSSVHSDRRADRHVFTIDEGATGKDMNGDGIVGGEFVGILEPGGILSVPRGVPGAPRGILGEHLALWVKESGTDHNGNGFDDFTWFAHDLATATTRLLGGSGATISGDDGERVVVVHAPEFLEGGDINGDGDRWDHVPTLLDLIAGTRSSVPFAVVHDEPWKKTFLSSSLLVVFALEEGEQQDLNGDGDLDDEVVTAVDVATQFVYSTGLTTKALHAHGDHAALLVAEDSVTGDLDGDGSADDVVLCLYDHLVGSWSATTIQAATENMVGERGRVLFLARETNADLNGDGDTTDIPFVVVEMASGNVLTATDAQGDVGDLLAGEFGFALTVYESVLNEDLNGDGDQIDSVVQIVRRR